MKTKYILLVRHGDGDQSLSKESKKYLDWYEYVLQQLFDSLTIGIYYSPFPLAQETAEIFKKYLSPREFIAEQKLLSDKNHDYDFEWLSDFVQKKQGIPQKKSSSSIFSKLFKKEKSIKEENPVDVMIFVTHMSYVEFFPNHFAKKMGIVDKQFDFMVLPGRSVLIDTEKWEALLLPCKEPELKKFLER